MNNTINMKKRTPVSMRTAEVPGWLVMLARIILWFDKAETKALLRAVAAFAMIFLTVMFAGGISCGNIPFALGAVICAALSMIALLLTKDFV